MTGLTVATSQVSLWQATNQQHSGFLVSQFLSLKTSSWLLVVTLNAYLNFKAYSFYENQTKVWDFNPCSFASIIQEDKFNFSSDYLISLQNNETPPMILDWAIGNERIPHVLISIPTAVLGTDVIARMVTVEFKIGFFIVIFF